MSIIIDLTGHEPEPENPEIWEIARALAEMRGCSAAELIEKELAEMASHDAHDAHDAP